jgi:long-chain acyl-CoA synthetase
MSEPAQTIPQCLLDIVKHCPTCTALQYKTESAWEKIAYQDLRDRVAKVLHFLLRLELQKGERVAICLENRVEWPIIYFGTVSAGLTAVPLDVQLDQPHLESLLIDCDAKVLFCSRETFLNKLSPKGQGSLKRIVALDLVNFILQKGDPKLVHFSQIINQTNNSRSLPEIHPDDIASLIYTSGTTEKPKGVLLTHKNICSNFFSIKKMRIVSAQDNFLSLLPLHHTYPFMVTLILPLFIGARITYNPPGFRPQDLAAVMKETGVTVLQGVPQLFSLLHAAISHQVKNIPALVYPLLLPVLRLKIRNQFGYGLRILVSGGARISPQIGRDLASWGLRFTEGYGLTETAPVVTMNPLSRVKYGSVGKPIPDVEVKINAPDENGVGEVLIKGPNVMAGYFRRPDLTIDVLKGGWFHSGDLGYIDQDGYLFLTGREKEMIVLSSGKKIIPEELEEVYQRSPYIKELCVFPKREHRFGQDVETLFAVIVPNLDQCRLTKEGNIQAKIRWELENQAKDLPPYKHIMGFVLTKEDLPRTALRKLKRYAVMERYLDQTSEPAKLADIALTPEELQSLDQDTAQRVLQYLSQQIHKPIGLESHLEIDLGIDSLSRVEMGLGLERLFKITIPDEDLGTITTVKELILRITALRQTTTIKKDRDFAETQKATWQYLLKQNPTALVLSKIRCETALVDRILTPFLKLLFLIIFRTIWFLRIRKIVDLPKEGPYLLCPNHASYLDGVAVFCSLPLSIAIKTYFLGYSLIFEHWALKWSMKLARLVSIDASVRLTEAMQIAAYLLTHQKIVCIFPEAERSIDGQVKTFRKGVGILVKELNVPVIPVYIQGSHEAWARGKIFPRPFPMKITFGKPLTRNELLAKKAAGASDDYETIAQRLREEVIKLSTKPLSGSL